MDVNDHEAEERILNAAHEVFVRRGTAGARMQEIADEAGVNKALLHYYYRNKDRLAEAVFRRAASRLFPAVMRIMASDAAIEEKVKQVVNVEIDTLLRSPYLPGYIVSELHHHPERAAQFLSSLAGVPIDGVAPRIFAVLREQLDERVRAGTMRPITPDQFFINLVSLIIFPFAAAPMLCAVFQMDREGFRAMMERRRAELPDLILRSLRP